MHTDAEIDHLEELLSNIEVMPDAMCASELDGYVAGLLLCPEMIMPGEWLSEVWALDGEPSFESMEQAQETIGAVMAHYNRVAQNLASRTQPYEIILERPSKDEEPFWEFWIAGFEQAMQLRPKAWLAYLNADDTEVATAFSVMCALLEIERDDSSLPADKQEDLIKHACDLIPDLIVIMNDWIKSQSTSQTPEWLAAANINAGPARSTKVGRNQPCPCGSGRKFKQCCVAK